jgi:hypothetical protein
MVEKRGRGIGLYEFRMTSLTMLRTCPGCSRRFHLESSLCMALHSAGLTPFHTRNACASLFTASALCQSRSGRAPGTQAEAELQVPIKILR